MKSKSVRLWRVLGVILVLVAVIVFLLLGTSSASGQYPIDVVPKVNVESGGSLNITGGTTGNKIDFGSMGPGTSKETTLTLGVTANNAWHLTVSKNQDLTYSMIEARIPSADFTFKSNGDAVANYVTSNTEFAAAPGCNVVTNGSATGGSNVNVVYKLVIPGDQPCNDQAFGYYSAVHTYTLVVGTP